MLVLLKLLACTPHADAATFQVTNITAHSAYDFSFGLSLNDDGVVATVGRIGGIDDFVLVGRSGIVTNLTQGQYTHVGPGSINDAGEAAFVGNASTRSLEDGEVLVFDGSDLSSVTSGSPTPKPAGVLGRTLNNSGQIAFATTSGLYFWDGTNLTNITARSGIKDVGNIPPALNNFGDISFSGLVSGRRHVFLFDGNLLANLSKDASLKIFRAARSAVNDAGEVAFLGRTTSNVVDLFYFDGTKTVNLSQSLDLASLGVAKLREVALNNLGQIAFTDSAGALWFLENGRVDLVTSSVGLGGLSMNDLGEIVVYDPEPGLGNILFASPLDGNNTSN